MTHIRPLIMMIFGVALIASGAALIAESSSVASATPTLTVSPAAQSVAPGQTFTVDVLQNADVETTGMQSDIAFDPSLLQVVDVARGAAYTGSSMQIGVAPQTKAQAIAEANTTGTMKNVAVYFLIGTSTVPAGEQTAVTVTFMANPAANGTSSITLSRTKVITGSPDFLTLVPTVTNGSVLVGTGIANTATPSAATTSTPSPTSTSTPPPTASPTSTQTEGVPIETATDTPTAIPTETATSTATVTATPSPVPTVAVTVTPAATLRVDPVTQSVGDGASFPVRIMQNANVATGKAQTDLTFDKTLVQITSIDAGMPYMALGAQVSAGSNQTLQQAIDEANASGTLLALRTSLLGGFGVNAGDREAFVVTMNAVAGKTGISALNLANSMLLTAEGAPFAPVTADGMATLTGPATATATAINTNTSTPTNTTTSTATPSPSSTSTMTPTSTSTRTSTPTSTQTSAATGTSTPVSTATISGSATPTGSPTNTAIAATSTGTAASSATAVRTVAASSARAGTPTRVSSVAGAAVSPGSSASKLPKSGDGSSDPRPTVVLTASLLMVAGAIMLGASVITANARRSQ